MRAAGIDLAFVRNACAVVIGEDAKPWRIVAMREWLPDGTPLVPTATCRAIAAECVKHGVTVASADGHYRELLREELSAVDIALVDAPAAPFEAWEPTQLAFLEDRVRVPFDEGLQGELEKVRFTYESGGRTAVHLDTSADGSHSDKAAALALCVWLLDQAQDTGRILGGRAARGAANVQTVSELAASLRMAPGARARRLL